MLKGIGPGAVFYGMTDVLAVAFAVTVLCFWAIYSALGQNPLWLPQAVFVSAPLLYGLIFLFSWIKELQNGTFAQQLSYRYTFFHVLAIRMFASSFMGLGVNGIYALLLALRCPVDGVRLFALSFTSLMLFSLILLIGILKGGSIYKGLALGGAWMAVQAGGALFFNGDYQRLLDAVPIYVLIGAGLGALVIYMRELARFLGVGFRKEYMDAEY